MTGHSFSAGSLVALVLTASSATAQSLNVNFGTFSTPPASTYGAAASQSGFWNEAVANLPGQPLVSLGGTVTGVTVDTTGNNYAFDNAGTVGDDEALLDTLLDDPTSVVFRGLEPGDYDVYTYAWAPDSAAFITDVEVLGSLDPLQGCGGA